MDLHVAIIIYTSNYHIMDFTFISLVENQSYTGDFNSPKL